MPKQIRMPKLSDTMEEGKIIKWLKQPGDTVKAGDLLAEVETDKANMEMESYDEGVVQELRVGEGESAPVGAVIAVLGVPGEAKPAGKKTDGKGDGKAAQPAKAAEEQPAREAPKPAAKAPEPAKPGKEAPPPAARAATSTTPFMTRCAVWARTTSTSTRCTGRTQTRRSRRVCVHSMTSSAAVKSATSATPTSAPRR